MKEKFKLLVLRIMFIMALSASWIGTYFIKKEYHFPVEWLLHYLVGTGKDKKVPARVLKQAEAVFAEAILKNHLGNEDLGGLYAVSHSTMYEGSGFSERPSLFYILGCFLFSYEPRTGKISGSDHYDWHSDPEADSYFTSPLGYNKWIVKACNVLGKIFGDDLFVTERSDFNHLVIAGGYSGQAAISNKLWEVLEVAGAKEFDTIFEGYVHIPRNIVSMAIRNHRRNGRDIAIERFSRIIKRAIVSKYEDGDLDCSEITINAYCGDYIKATVCVYAETEDYESELIAKETHYYNISEDKSVHRVYGYDLALAKAAIHTIEFNQKRFKRSIKEKRGLITRNSIRSSMRRDNRRRDSRRNDERVFRERPRRS